MERLLHSAALLSVVLWTSGTAAEAPKTDPAWVDGPVRWLLQPAELRRWHRLDSGVERTAFSEEFWHKRSASPKEETSKRQRFERRVSEADLLFDDESVAGSLTDRGRAYILLGPPSELLQSYRKIPDLQAVTLHGRRQPTAQSRLEETWNWRPEDLSLDLQREMGDRRWRVALRVRFVSTGHRHRLEEGESLLKVAARSWLDASP